MVYFSREKSILFHFSFENQVHAVSRYLKEQEQSYIKILFVGNEI